jgi:iron complex outermembrane receptor protein
MKININIIYKIALLFCLNIGELNADSRPEVEKSSNEENPPTEMYITGALTPIGLDRLGKPVSIITHEELQERSESTLGELLSSEPGVSGTYFGPGASRPVIRGQSKQRVRVLENGLESGDVSDISEDHAVAVDPLSVERIDILRGPSTLLYGSSAIGGVVNMIDKSIAQEAVGRPIAGEVDLRKGDSADEESSGAASFKGEIGSLNWHFSSFYRETDDIEIPGFAESSKLREMEEVEEHEHEEVEHEQEQHEEEEARGKLENSDTLSKGFKIGGSHVWNQGFFGIGIKTFDSKYGVPGGHAHHEEALHEEEDEEEEHLEGEALPRIDLNQFRLESRGEVRMNDDFFRAVRFGAIYSNYEHKELEGDETATKFDKDSFEGRVELTHAHEDGLEGGWGTQFRYDDFKAEGEEAFLPPSKTIAPALFAIEDYRISDNLVWQLGGRYEYVNVDADAISSKNFNMFSASTGPVMNLDSEGVYTAGLSLSYSERAPTSTELFADGAHIATQSFEIGDSDLNKEQSFGTEFVLRKNTGRLTGTTSLFWQQYSDYINLVPSGEEEEDLLVYLYEMDRARFWGFEAEGDYQLFSDNPHGFHLYGQIDYVRGDNLSNDDPLPRITPLRGKIGVKYKHENASAYVEGVFVDEQDETADFELPTDSYSLLNTGVAYQLPLDDRNTYELYARATNLTDEEARVHTSFLKDVAPLRGRAFFAGVRLVF